jgi:hypothetical protein
MIFWGARYLSWSAVFGSPYSDGGLRLDALTVNHFTKPITLALASLIRLLEGVKNPREARFFSTLTKSTFERCGFAGEDAGKRSRTGRDEHGHRRNHGSASVFH